MSGAIPNAVLIVDDEVLIRMLIADELLDTGLVTFEAGSAQEALALLDQHPEITVLFTDINMPGAMNGIELARIAQTRRPDIRIYLSSGRCPPSNDEWPERGVFIEKPYHVERVAEMIRAAA